MITPTRQIGNAKLYKLNLDNIFTKKLTEIFDAIILQKKKVAV